MCQVADIIVVKNPKRDNEEIGKHSFIVISTENGKIQGLDFDMVCNIMGSFDGKGSNYRRSKLDFPGNVELKSGDTDVPCGNQKHGYVKADAFFYFDSEKTDYEVIGTVNVEFFNKLIRYIEKLENIVEITDNLN